MNLLQNLYDVPENEQLNFINSFDHILSDMDGVIWLFYRPIPGAVNCMKTLKQIGKHVHYVTNNSARRLELVHGALTKHGFNATIEDISLPVFAIISYLKKIKFNKDIYVVGMSTQKEALKAAGFSVMDGPEHIEESVPSIISNVADNENIGCVIVDFDLNINFVKLQKCITYLKREDCLFIAGPGDVRLATSIGDMIGPQYFIKPILDLSGREPYKIAKPDPNYNEFLMEKYNIMDPKRVLFIGDSISEDMNFATNCGYQKLLVLTGVTQKEHISNWTHPENDKPKYYVESLEALNEIIKKVNVCSKI